MDKKILLLIVLVIPLMANGQEPIVENGQQKKSAYLKVGIGAGASSFRDQATSPLFYQGTPISAFVSRVKVSDRKETNLGVSFIAGEYTAEVNEKQRGMSSFSSFNTSYSRLYQLQNWSDENWKYKVGGTLMMTANFRSNEKLQNNSFGFEGFLNLLGSFKVSRDVSRENEKQKKFLFINYTLKPRERILSYQLNLGLWNSSLRNGYAYINQSSVINDYSFLDGYVLKTFSGLRFSSELNYTLFLLGARNNAVQISYVWDAVQTEAGAEVFAMAFHVFRLSLLYNTK